MAINIITADFTEKKSIRCADRYQYDYGQVLKVEGIDGLPDAFTAQFAIHPELGDAMIAFGTAGEVEIPNDLFETGNDIYAYIIMHEGEDDGRTCYTAKIPVIARAKPVDEEPTPHQQSALDRAIAALNGAVEDAETAASQAQTYASNAGESATAASGSASAAADSATAAAGYAGAASGSATAAERSADGAAGAATSAASSAEAAHTSETNAAGSATNAAASADAAAESAEDAAQVAQEMRATTAAIIIDSASGAVVSVPDGADDLPMQSVKVSIQPIQDLHGQGAPYPAGASANLFKATPYSGEYNKAVGGDLKNYQPMPYEITSDGKFVIDIQTAWRGRLFATDALTAGDYAVRTYGNSSSVRFTLYVTDSDLLVKSVINNQGAAGWGAIYTASVSDGDRIAVFLGANTAEKITTEFQVNSGTTIATIVPFENICPISGWDSVTVTVNGTDYPTDLPTTVYGGTLDVVSGELTVDRAMVDLGTLNWVYNTTTSSIAPYFYVNYSGIKSPGAPYTYPINAVCSQYPVVVRSSATAKDKTLFGDGSISSITQIQIKDSAYTDAAAFKTAMNGVQLCYELLTPQTYHLTPQEIRTLLGSNTVMSEAGSVEITYPCDTKKFIIKMVS